MREVVHIANVSQFDLGNMNLELFDQCNFTVTYSNYKDVYRDIIHGLRVACRYSGPSQQIADFFADLQNK